MADEEMNQLDYERFNATELTHILAFDSYEDYINYLNDESYSEYSLSLVGAGGNIPNYEGYDVRTSDTDQSTWSVWIGKRVLYVGETEYNLIYNHIYVYDTDANEWVDDGYNENLEKYDNLYYGDSKVTDIIITADTPTSTSEYPNNKFYIKPIYSDETWLVSGQTVRQPIGYQVYFKHNNYVSTVATPIVKKVTSTNLDYIETSDPNTNNWNALRVYKYIGTTTQDLTEGSYYQYQNGAWVEISESEVYQVTITWNTNNGDVDTTLLSTASLADAVSQVLGNAFTWGPVID